MSRRLFIPALSAVLGFAVASPTQAQSIVAADAGVATTGAGQNALAVFETGVRFSSLKPKQVTADLRIATAPRALAAGVLVLAADLDAAFVLSLGERAYATPRAGVSLIGGIGSDGVGGLPGVNYGFGLVARTNEPLAVRFDYTRFMYWADLSVGVSTFSIGIAWVH